jgi:hypothetical protein
MDKKKITETITQHIWVMYVVKEQNNLKNFQCLS